MPQSARFRTPEDLESMFDLDNVGTSILLPYDPMATRG